jgi:tyrosyl-tRNA synthetase
MLQRDDYSQRFAEHKPIGIHEFLYPLLQAYDSVAIEADVEFGGTDQKFNLLVGRELQVMMGQPPQQCFLVPLLVGTDGKVKMSKSLGNYIALEDPPDEMYGKTMSLPDAVMMDYFELATDVPDEELAEMREALRTRSVNPMDFKMRLAREVVGQFHSAEAARGAAEHFTKVFRKRELPEEPAEAVFTSREWEELRAEGLRLQAERFMGKDLAEEAKRLTEEEEAEVFPWTMGGRHRVSVPLLLVRMGLAGSKSEARRKIKEGAVDIDGRVCTGFVAGVSVGSVIRVGRQFKRIVDADKQSES